jgi:hypothetical protein
MRILFKLAYAIITSYFITLILWAIFIYSKGLFIILTPIIIPLFIISSVKYMDKVEQKIFKS